MPKYEYRFTTSAGLLQLASVLDVADDRSAKAHGQTIFATFLDFDILEVWLLDRWVATLRRPSLPDPSVLEK
jgi:hypothetical protein